MYFNLRILNIPPRLMVVSKMSLVRPAGDSDFESTDEDDLYDEFCGQSDRSNAKNGEVKLIDQTLKEAASKGASEQRNPMILHDMQTAISTGNAAAVERLLEKVDSPDVLLNSGWPLIVHAAYFCHHSIIQLLIKHGACVNAVNDTGDTALHAACKSGVDPGSESIMKTVKELISSGANVDAKDFNGRTPLMYACRRNLTDIVKYLLELGNPHKRIFLRDDRDWNCIDWCAIFSNIDSLKAITDILQITIDPKKLSSSKLWPNHVFEFLQTSNQAVTIEQNQTIDNHGVIESGASTTKSSTENIHSLNPNGRKSSEEYTKPNLSTAMDIEEPDHGLGEGSSKNQTPRNENIGDMYPGNKSVDQVNSDVIMGQMNSTCHHGTSDKPIVDDDTSFGFMEDEDEECILPTVIKRDTKKVEGYETYGHLELFLAGLELSHLIPLFQKQDIKFEELLCFSMDELEKIGIKAYGTRKRILSAIQECHDKHTSTSLLPDYTKTPLTANTMFRMMDGSSEQIEYIASCMRYIRYHVQMYPDTLYPDADETYDKAPLQLYQEKIDSMTRSLVNLAKSLDDLKIQAEDFEHKTCPELTEPVGLATLENLKDFDQRAKMKRLFAISIAVLAMYLWKKSSLYS